MDLTFKTGINWAKLVIALVLMCFMFSFSAMAQTKQEKPLNAEAVSALVQELTDGLPDLIADENQVAEITEKWDEREGLAGKTRTQILNLLFADVKSVVADKNIQDEIWASWKEAGMDGEEEQETPPSPDKPVTPPPPKTPTAPKSPEPCPDVPVTLLVSNLTFQITDEDLLELFSKAGKVVSATVQVDPDTAFPRGFAYVVMSNVDVAEAARSQFNGFDLNGWKMSVTFKPGEKIIRCKQPTGGFTKRT
jgi:hypothetical protein